MAVQVRILMKTETRRFTETKMLKTMTAAFASLFLLGCDPMGSKEVDTGYAGPDYINGSALVERELDLLVDENISALGTFHTVTYKTNLEEVEVMAGPGLYLFEKDQLGTFSDGSYSGYLYDYEQDQDQTYIGDYESTRTYVVDPDTNTFVVVVYFDSNVVPRYDMDWQCPKDIFFNQHALINLGAGLLETTFLLDVEIDCE